MTPLILSAVCVLFIIVIVIILNSYDRKIEKLQEENKRLRDIKIPPGTPENPPAPATKKTPDFEITEEYLKVKTFLKERKPVIFIHGGAGTGKSFLIRYLREQGLINVLLAPTGLAALNIEGMTIHKFLGLPPTDLFPKGEEHQIPKDHYAWLQHAKTICIDEISMVRADLLDQIDRSLRSAGDPQKIFGGYQMIFVGDLYQLPPVVNSKVSQKKTHKPITSFFRNKTDERNDQQWDSPWFLDADCMKNQPFERVDLTKVFRQTDHKFISILNEIREYENLQNNISCINKNITLRPLPETETVTLVLTNNQANKINKKKISSLKNQITYSAAEEGTFCNKNINNKRPVPLHLTLAEKAFVMILCNNPDGKFVNGTTGVIESLTKDHVNVRLPNGIVEPIVPYTWKSYHIEWDNDTRKFKNVEDGSYTQIPLIPAYAITCHKAQGKTLDRVHLSFAGQAFDPGQTYVALSRVHEISGISSDRTLKMSDFKRDNRLAEFKTMKWI